MRNDRRDFVLGAGALLGSALGAPGIALAAGGPGPARTKAGLEEIVRLNSHDFAACIHTTETIDGPFYYPSSLERRNLAEGRPGLKLRLGITVLGFGGPGRCAPVTGAVIDIWHTDASSLYSHVGADLQYRDTVGETFCRGHYVTDDKGYVEFDTIVPGWEILASAPPPPGVTPPPGMGPPGGTLPPVLRRTTHIHVKVFKDYSIATTQLYLPDPFLAGLYANTEPYRSHRMLAAPGVKGTWERVANTDDPFFIEAPRPLPLDIQRKGDQVLATAKIGVSFGSSTARESLWR